MNRTVCVGSFLSGLIAVLWVGSGYVGTNPLALTITAVIGAVYLAGAMELLRFHQATATLTLALEALPHQLSHLGDWLVGIHPSLQNPVRLRIEGERSGLPGPVLTPYLLGLLVMLGMLGTFLGMVVTLNGAVLALESTTDLQTIRASLAAPVKGLGLAFGTSVAGVMASAMLGLISVLCRRERLQTAQRLDTCSATSLRGFSLLHQRQETFRALQLHAQALPDVAEKLQAMMLQIERQGQHLNDRLLANQEDFHDGVKRAYTDLARSVDTSLQQSLIAGARAAGEAIRPVAETTLSGIAHETSRLQSHLAETVGAHLDGLASRFDTGLTTLEHSWTTALANHERSNQQLRQELASSIARDNAMLDERLRIMASLNTLLDTLQIAAAEQRTAVDALIRSSVARLDDLGSQFERALAAESAKASDMTTQISASAVEVSSLSESFSCAVQMFATTNEQLMANLQSIEGALGKSMTRSDEQLAYYVAQARELIDLSIMAQSRIVDDRPPHPGAPARLADEVW